MPSRILYTSLVFLLCCCLHLHAQVPAPPPSNQSSWTVEVPRWQWTLSFHGGILGFSPSQTKQISGTNRFERTGNFGFGTLTDNDGKTHVSITANTAIGLSTGTVFANESGTHFHTIEAQFAQNKACYSFIPPFYWTFQGDTFGRWVMTDKYLYYGLSYQWTFSTQAIGLPVRADYMYMRGTFGSTFYHRNFDVKIQQDRFEDWTDGGTGMTARTIQASKQSYMMSFELGFAGFSPDYDRSWSWGVVAHVPFTDTYTDQYEFKQNGTSVGVSNTTYTGATVMMNVRYTFNFKPKDKPGDSTSNTPDVFVLTDTSRAVDVQESFEVHNKRVRIRVWDRNEVDGDVVTLTMNDELIKQNLKLRKRKKSFTVKLKPGSNILVMYAENLGDIPPNTAALEIKDGRKKRNVNLVSDKDKSGAVELIYVPK